MVKFPLAEKAANCIGHESQRLGVKTWTLFCFSDFYEKYGK